LLSASYLFSEVLNVYSRANTQSGAQKAIQFFHDMEKPIDEGGYDVKPDRMSYSMLIQACSRAIDAPVFAATKSEEYLEYAEQKIREEKAQQDIISSAAPLQLYLKADDFNLVLIAISRSHQRNGPQRAIRIIKRMQQYAKEGQEDVLPNIKSWTGAYCCCLSCVCWLPCRCTFYSPPIMLYPNSCSVSVADRY
jgi:hypothetical protein